ncbi:adenylate/guanylate cyclase domain-containing protein [uncultured Tateyamaria sp.]|uniref:adenylate/guanylate cyclase domain-containing protein n=1 Tax=uncultured Tateyamaria sp. TaxID=455651 RepID=UPI00261D2198|nr:adenylate/guanylate cyclase domain-containing protein [uncultured Tateyamaria sp.]
MITPSPELAAITARWVKSMVSQEGATLSNMLSTSDPVLFCGTAEKEVYRNDFFRANYARHIEEIPIGQLSNVEIEAYENGQMGWAFWHGHIQFPNSNSGGMARITLIFQLDQGLWKIQHIHNSFPVANVEAWGYEHNALDELLDAAAAIEPNVGKTGIAAVMFTDIADSSELAAIVGDTAWTKRVSRHMGVLRSQIEEAEGNLVKTLGDGTMSIFPSARAAMTAAQCIQRRMADDTTEPRLSLRIGIHTGDVVQAGDDFFGTVVNKAARVAAVAKQNEIRVSDATRIMVGATPDFVFEDTARVPLKGFEGEHVIHRLDW